MTHKPPETLYARRKTRATTTTANTTSTSASTSSSTSSSTSTSTSPLSSPDTTTLINTNTIHLPQISNTTPTPTTTTAPSSSTTKPRRRGRSLRTNLLLRPHHTSPIPSPPSPITIPSSTIHDDDDGDEQNDDDGNVVVNGGGGRRGRSGSFMLLLRQQEIESAADTAYYGFVVLGATWVVFVVGMGSVLGVWEWAWDVPDSPFPRIVNEAGVVKDASIPGYYPALVILTCVMAWVWVVVAWMGMKYFKHAKIQGGGDDG